jgi:TRAP-type C4-dicarboxylate transport system permease small subunit
VGREIFERRRGSQKSFNAELIQKMQTRSIGLIAGKLSIFIERLAAYPCIAATGAMTVVVILGVVFRYVLQSPLSWSEEVARYLMIWAASLAISIGIMRREHLGITFVISRIPASAQKYVALLVNLAVLWFLWILTKFGYYMALEGQTQLSPVLAKYKINMMWSLSAIPVAGALAIIQTVLQMVTDIFRSKEDTEDMDTKGMVDI